RIEKIFETAELLKELIPEAKIGVTHGRMDEKILDGTLRNFINGDINLLVTTAIVESGLDIKNANTIIVNDAHTFGLADLYQLKGRVGRSDVEAYSYFLIPSLSSLTVDARKRLQMLSELTELGSGFKLALSDLEIRGAGNLFGKEQSGHIGDIGLEFYLELLKSTINTIKNEKTAFDYEPEIKTVENAFIPDDYIESSSQRLFYYKKISSVQKNHEILEIVEDLEDRFGKIPAPLKNLLDICELKIILKELLIRKVDITKDKAEITFLEFSPYSKMFKPDGKYKIVFNSKNKFQELKKRINDICKSKVKSS
ncbi:MAG: TRCF domain-containing protein, partial [Thermodesulfobacteriota bacterium]